LKDNTDSAKGMQGTFCWI